MNDDMNSSSDASQTPFEHKVSLSTSLIAVALSLSAIYANMLGDTVLIARAEANNAWSYFQAKSMKQHFHSTQREMLLLELEQANISPNYRQKVLLKIRDYTAQIKRYEQEKTDIQIEAKKQEKIHQNLDNQGNILNYAEALYEISIILAAISLLARSRLMWFTSMGLGFSGAIITAYVYLFF